MLGSFWVLFVGCLWWIWADPTSGICGCFDFGGKWLCPILGLDLGLGLGLGPSPRAWPLVGVRA